MSEATRLAREEMTSEQLKTAKLGHLKQSYVSQKKVMQKNSEPKIYAKLGKKAKDNQTRRILAWKKLR